MVRDCGVSPPPPNIFTIIKISKKKCLLPPDVESLIVLPQSQNFSAVTELVNATHGGYQYGSTLFNK